MTPRRRGTVAWRVFAVMVAAAMASVIVLLAIPSEMAPLAAPLLVNVDLALFFVAVLLFSDGQMPVFESGSLWVAATLVYATFPFVGFMAGGMKWTADMDNRLQQYPFDSSEIVWFAWQYTIYLAAFIVAYLAVRRRAVVPTRAFQRIRPSTAAALVFGFVALSAVPWILYVLYGIRFDVSHEAADMLEMVAKVGQVPLLAWQVMGHMVDAIQLGRLGVAILLLANWRQHRWPRVVLVLWLALDIAQVVMRESVRSSLVLLLLCVVLLYHRLVRPLTLAKVAIGSAVLIAGFVTLGLLRLHTASLNVRSGLTAMNEFQALFATAFELYQRQKLGTLGPVPWQVYTVDLYLEIPRQLLPFEKLDPSEWYLDVIGARGQGVGFMFGVMAQAVLGLKWVELLLRGAVLGAIYAALHRWYVRRATRLWPTMLYIYVSILSYYTFRATTFWGIHFIVYKFLPFMAVVKCVEFALERRNAMKVSPAGTAATAMVSAPKLKQT